MAFEDYEIRTRPMTSDEVLATLIDQQRDDFGETLLASVTPASPVKALFDTYPILPWGDIANSLNAMFELSVSLDEWRPVLLPKRRRTVGALCDFIARRATILDIQPVTVMGDTSLAAGVFLAMRHILAAWAPTSRTCDRRHPSPPTSALNSTHCRCSCARHPAASRSPRSTRRCMLRLHGERGSVGSSRCWVDGWAFRRGHAY